MDLYHLCREAGLSAPEGAEACEISGIQTRSGSVRQGDLFLCIRGMTSDGHAYINQAIERGAAAVVAESAFDGDMPTAVPVVIVNDTRHAAAMLYDAWYGHPSKKLKIIAVTGTNGKTSVTHMLRAVFEGDMHKCGLIGTVDCYSAGKKLDIRSQNPLANMTTPDPEELYRMLAVMVDDGVEYVFMEATSHALALRKLDALWFEAAIFTNLTPDHLDFHGDMENYFCAKAQLFSRCKKAILNVDDAYGKRLADTIECPMVTCSCKGAGADFSAEDICDRGVDGSEYSVVSRNLRFALRTPIPGSFNVINTLEAAACAACFGVSPSVITTALGSLWGIAGRMERVKLGTVTDFSVFIDYAHTPDALSNLLMSAQRIKRRGQRIVLVFGCGGDRDKRKRPVMGKIAEELADFCVVTSDNSRSEDPKTIINDILAGMSGENHIVIPGRARAIEYVIHEAREGDIILLAGKGHEEYEIDRDGKHPFSEKKLAKQAALRYRSGGSTEEQVDQGKDDEK